MWVIGFVAEVGLALWLLIKGTHSQTALTPQRLSMTPTRPPAARPEDMPARQRLDTGLALALASGRRAVERG